jgi:tetratricopeptide (TPR) repeat protein
MTSTHDFTSRFQLGNELMGRGDDRSALEIFAQLVASHPESANAMYNRGVCLYRLGRVDEALADFDAYLALHPGDADALQMRARCLAPGDDAPVTGRHVLSLFLRFAGMLAIVFGAIATLIFVAIPMQSEANTTPGMLLMGACVLVMLAAAPMAIACKFAFGMALVSFVVERLASLRFGRSFVGFALMAAGAYLAWGVGGSVWERGFQLSRLRELIGVTMLVLMLGFGGLAMAFSEPPESPAR